MYYKILQEDPKDVLIKNLIKEGNNLPEAEYYVKELEETIGRENLEMVIGFKAVYEKKDEILSIKDPEGLETVELSMPSRRSYSSTDMVLLERRPIATLIILLTKPMIAGEVQTLEDLEITRRNCKELCFEHYSIMRDIIHDGEKNSQLWSECLEQMQNEFKVMEEKDDEEK